MVLLLYNVDEVTELPFQAARLELERLTAVPAYSVPSGYVGALLVRTAQTAADSQQLAGAVGRARGWVGQQAGPAARAAFWSEVHAKSFAPATAARSFV